MRRELLIGRSLLLLLFALVVAFTVALAFTLVTFTLLLLGGLLRRCWRRLSRRWRYRRGRRLRTVRLSKFRRRFATSWFFFHGLFTRGLRSVDGRQLTLGRRLLDGGRCLRLLRSLHFHRLFAARGRWFDDCR